MGIKSKLTFENLYDLYINKKLSTYKIADQYNYDPKTVYYWLKKFEIKTRSTKKLAIKKGALIDLYENKKMSLKQIGKLYNMTPSGILRHVRKHNIKTRTSWDINTGNKVVFSRNMEEKAYLIGFRLGDLGVRLSPKTRHVKIGSNTTKREQIVLLRNLFKNYSKTWISKPNKIGVMSFSAILDPTFSFLLPKKDDIDQWIQKDDKYMNQFISGYIDAEGSFGVYNNRGKFRLGSFDFNILNQINSYFERKGIKTCFSLDRKKGISKNGQVLNNDFWRITINEAKSLLKLYNILFAGLKHKKRIIDFKKVRMNINFRLKSGTIHA